jgi:cholesterol oxidase
LFFTDSAGHNLTLSGRKVIKDDPGFDVWHDTTTLFTSIFKGHVSDKEEAGAECVAAGILTIHVLDFLHQLTTFHTEGPTLQDRNSARTRFARLFLGKLWDVYARGALTSGPF